VTGPAVIKLGISNLVWPRPWRPKLCLLEQQRAGREGGERSGAAPAPPRRLPSSRCNKAALSGPPSVCRRVRDSCVLRFSAPGGPALQGRAPARPAAGLHCCWSVPGSRQVMSPALRHARKDLALLALTAREAGRSRGDRWRRVPRTKTSCNKSLNRSKRCALLKGTRGRSGAASEGGDSCDSAPRRAALLGTFVHTQRTSRARASAVL
jgi:hypothetical protein